MMAFLLLLMAQTIHSGASAKREMLPESSFNQEPQLPNSLVGDAKYQARYSSWRACGSVAVAALPQPWDAIWV